MFVLFLLEAILNLRQAQTEQRMKEQSNNEIKGIWFQQILKWYYKRHAVVEFGRGLWTSSSPTPLLKQGQLKQAGQDHWVLNISKDGVSIAFLENVLHHSTTITVQFFLMLQWNFAQLNLCLLPLVVSPPTAVKSLPPFYLLPLVSVHW